MCDLFVCIVFDAKFCFIPFNYIYFFINLVLIDAPTLFIYPAPALPYSYFFFIHPLVDCISLHVWHFFFVFYFTSIDQVSLFSHKHKNTYKHTYTKCAESPSADKSDEETARQQEETDISRLFGITQKYTYRCLKCSTMVSWNSLSSLYSILTINYSRIRELPRNNHNKTTTTFLTPSYAESESQQSTRLSPPPVLIHQQRLGHGVLQPGTEELAERRKNAPNLL